MWLRVFLPARLCVAARSWVFSVIKEIRTPAACDLFPDIVAFLMFVAKDYFLQYASIMPNLSV